MMTGPLFHLSAVVGPSASLVVGLLVMNWEDFGHSRACFKGFLSGACLWPLYLAARQRWL